jgi:hypothetical protein
LAETLPPMIGAELRSAMFELLQTLSRSGEQPWARLCAEGHGDGGPAADYIDRHIDAWTAALLG